jgi:long-subunit acyl-CoA synthetase (AMP-forming)
MGEIVMRGNGVMKGYFKDPEGKIQKFDLREKEWSGHVRRIHG